MRGWRDDGVWWSCLQRVRVVIGRSTIPIGGRASLLAYWLLSRAQSSLETSCHSTFAKTLTSLGEGLLGR